MHVKLALVGYFRSIYLNIHLSVFIHLYLSITSRLVELHKILINMKLRLSLQVTPINVYLLNLAVKDYLLSSYTVTLSINIYKGCLSNYRHYV